MDRASQRRVIAERLRQLIARRGQTVANLERRMGRSRGYLADALRGEKRLSVETILEALETLGLEPQELFNRHLVAGEDASYVQEPEVAAVEPAPRLPASPADVVPTLAALLRVLQRKGFVSRQELEAAYAEARRAAPRRKP